MKKLIVMIYKGYLKLALVEMRNRKLLKYSAIELTEDTVVDSEIIKHEYLKNLILSFHKTRNVLIILASPKTIIRFFKVPELSERELKKSIVSSYKDIFPIDTSQYVCSYRRCTEKGIGIIAAAIPKIVPESYVKLFAMAKMNIMAIDILECCIGNYFSQIDKNNIIIVYENEDRLSFMYMTDGIIIALCSVDKNMETYETKKLSLFIAQYENISTAYLLDLRLPKLEIFFDNAGIDVKKLNDITVTAEFYEVNS